MSTGPAKRRSLTARADACDVAVKLVLGAKRPSDIRPSERDQLVEDLRQAADVLRRMAPHAGAIADILKGQSA